jgi:DNA-binding NtrC family response regulator
VFARTIARSARQLCKFFLLTGAFAAVIFPPFSRHRVEGHDFPRLGGGAVLAEASTILIVERSDEVREVLRIALARRGLLVYETSRLDVGLELARRHHPSIIVLDLDAPPGDVAHGSIDLAAHADSVTTPMILLGSVRRDCWRSNQFVAKPYHYRSLISRIEQLLEARRARDIA